MKHSVLGRCQCRTCRRGYMRWLESLGRHRAAGGDLWLILTGSALAEPVRIVTSEPVRTIGALHAARLGTVELKFPASITITCHPLPAGDNWLNAHQRAVVLTLPRDEPLTVTQLSAHGIDLRALPSPASCDDGDGYRECRHSGVHLHVLVPCRRGGRMADRDEAIVTLQETLPVLADDEVRVLALVATRLAAGQRRYGRLSLRTDRRDWHTEAIEECADGLAYLAGRPGARRGATRMTLRAVRSGDQMVLTLPAPEVLDQLPIEELPGLVVQLTALATRWQRAGYPVCVLGRSGDGVPQSWEVKLARTGRKQLWLRLVSSAMSQWQAVARASAAEPARATEQVGFGV